jgi:tRNA dimethylallyltransferase
MGAYYQPIYLAGQTGSGKTGVSVELARRLGAAEIINADAFQIYQSISILSAAPREGEKGAITHHLFEIFPVDHECDAAQFATLARETINRVSATAIPVVVGGSGLYLKSITHGLGETPRGNSALRQELEKCSFDDLVSEYQRLDPEGAAATNLKNRRYVTRNLEICLLTGQAASKLKTNWKSEAPEFTGIYLQRNREEIYERINRRTRKMFADGVVEEIRQLSGELSATVAKAIGIREIQSFLAGEMTEEECIAAIQQITRRYAKRQETWFKKEPQYRVIPCQPDDSAAQIVDRILEIFPATELQSRKNSAPCPRSKKEIQPELN